MSEQKKSTRDTEKKDNDDETQVHSANSWETADLGDSDRKQKFLRLMGASKKEHKGRIVIGDHESAKSRTQNDVTKISDDLEDQYEQGMEHRRLGGRRGHLGLGFHESMAAGEKPESEKEQNEETGEKEESRKKETEEQVQASDCEKRKHSEETSDPNLDNPDESPPKKIKLNFVKASS